jgi:hypothetical protein
MALPSALIAAAAAPVELGLLLLRLWWKRLGP